ncbi:Metallo-dependent phosphatase [Ramaria rubella]|nr:Metallo-dependent phosphatase [Ramaria rubella]
MHPRPALLLALAASTHAATLHKPSPTTESKSKSTSTPSPSPAPFFAAPPAALSAPADFTLPHLFQTDFLHAFYPGLGPTQTTAEPQPLITDPVAHTVFPLDLTNPKTIPTANLHDPNLSTPGSLALRRAVFGEVGAILAAGGSAFNATCEKCVASLVALKGLALAAPWEVPPVLIELCEMVGFDAFGSCTAEFSANSDGQIATQLIASANVTGIDGQVVLPLFKSSSCPTPPPPSLASILPTWFAKPKPRGARAPRPSGGRALKVVHLSDFHIDPRYTIGSEANCTEFLCCRPGGTNALNSPTPLLPAPRFGSFECDTPWSLASAVMHAVAPLTGSAGEGAAPIDFTIFTGDLVSHDNDNALSRAYVEYSQSAVYSLFKEYLGGGPVYAALGNHDTWPQAYDAPHSLQPEQLSQQFEWNYEHLADLWRTEGWISEEVAAVSKATYSAYSTVTPHGLKIITMNTDFWYYRDASRWFGLVSMTNPDVSGMLRFVTDELQAAEDAGQRVWIMGHVPPGFDGTNALPNAPNLFYQIVERFSPHVIAGVFFGHNHDQQMFLWYANNGTTMSADTVLTPGWIGGSVTPLAGLNSGFSMYEVDPVTFDVMDAYTWFANVSSFPELDHQTAVGPAYHFEFSAREDYGGDFKWPSDAPLNGTFWHLVTESMETNPAIVNKFVLNQGRQSSLTTNCTSTECQNAKICYLRSGSPPVAARCARGFGSVQE